MITENTISRRGGWLAAWVGDELMMMSAESDVYLSLTGTGGRIWELLEEPRTLSGLCDALTTEYDVKPSQVLDEVMPFLERLQHNHAIELNPPAVG